MMPSMASIMFADTCAIQSYFSLFHLVAQTARSSHFLGLIHSLASARQARCGSTCCWGLPNTLPCKNSSRTYDTDFHRYWTPTQSLLTGDLSLRHIALHTRLLPGKAAKKGLLTETSCKAKPSMVTPMMERRVPQVVGETVHARDQPWKGCAAGTHIVVPNTTRTYTMNVFTLTSALEAWPAVTLL
jgi:hypothetical protein